MQETAETAEIYIHPAVTHRELIRLVNVVRMTATPANEKGVRKLVPEHHYECFVKGEWQHENS